MFSSCEDKTQAGAMFAHLDPSVDFSIHNFLDFVKSDYLTKHVNIYGGLSAPEGLDIDLDEIAPNIAQAVLEHFKKNNIRKETTFSTAFKPRANSHEYFPDLAETMVSVIELHGRPPLFHKKQDKVLRYEWEKE